MIILTKLYDRSLIWAQHRHAPRYLAAMSFAESSFFPIPPDVMLAPMALAKPSNAYFYAFITTLFSIIGGLFGYMIGYFAFLPLLNPYDILDKFPFCRKPLVDALSKCSMCYGLYVPFFCLCRT